MNEIIKYIGSAWEKFLNLRMVRRPALAAGQE